MRVEMGRLSKRKLDQGGLNWDTTAEDFESIFLHVTGQTRGDNKPED